MSFEETIERFNQKKEEVLNIKMTRLKFCKMLMTLGLFAGIAIFFGKKDKLINLFEKKEDKQIMNGLEVEIR